jgi:predicted transcriptional regulator YdeE
MADYEIVSLPAFTVAGLSIRTSNSRPDQIGQLWQEFYGQNIGARVPRKKSENVYSVYIDYESDHTGLYTLVIGYEIDPSHSVATQGLVSKQVPGSNFAVFEANGKQPDTLITTWQKVYTLDIRRTYSGDFDLYELQPGASGPSVSVYVAIE